MVFFPFLFFLRLLMLVTLFHICDGYASFKRSKYDMVDFYSFEKKRNELSLKLLWTHIIGCGSCGHCVDLYPAYEGSYIFAVDYRGIVKKLNFDTGECVWSKNLSNVFFNSFFKYSNSALLSGGVVFNKNCLYLGSESSKVYALHANTGAILWVSMVSGEVISRPVVTHGLVLVYTSNGVFCALDERNGTINWSVKFEVPFFSFRVTLLPVIYDDIVVIGDSSGVLSACNVNTGELIWQKKISNLKGITDIDQLSNIVAPVVKENIVYAIACNGEMVALDVFSGSLIWSREIGSLINIIVNDGFIYLIDQDNRVVALNKDNGDIIWSTSDLIHKKLITMMMFNRYILVGDTQGYLYCLYREDGTLLGKKKIAVGSLNNSMSVLNKIVFYEDNGKLSIWKCV